MFVLANDTIPNNGWEFEWDHFDKIAREKNREILRKLEIKLFFYTENITKQYLSENIPGAYNLCKAVYLIH